VTDPRSAAEDTVALAEIRPQEASGMPRWAERAGRGTLPTMTVRVLLVDDHPAYLERARQLLERHGGVEVAGIALSGGEAITLAGDVRPDLVLLDFQMPALNGIETAKRLKSLYPDLPVVIVTAHDDEAYRAAATAAGASGWISKTDIADSLGPLLVRLGLEGSR
jgi:DNA-binding NarL/FixJ family response regulator